MLKQQSKQSATSRKALGRGLASLLPDSDQDISKMVESRSNVSRSVNYIEISLIRPCPTQPRTNFNENEIDELASSINEVGVLQPVILRNSGDYYELIAGERRWRACKKLGLKKIPAIIKNCTDTQALKSALIENIQRKDLNPIEEAKAYRQLIDEHKLTHEEISKSVGKDRSTITNFLRLLKLPLNVQELITKNIITMGHAKVISTIESESKIAQVAYKIINENLSVRELENYVSRLISKKSKSTTSKTNTMFSDIEDNLRNKLKTKVKISGKENKGKIVINYYNKQEFERLYNTLCEGEF